MDKGHLPLLRHTSAMECRPRLCMGLISLSYAGSLAEDTEKREQVVNRVHKLSTQTGSHTWP